MKEIINIIEKIAKHFPNNLAPAGNLEDGLYDIFRVLYMKDKDIENNILKLEIFKEELSIKELNIIKNAIILKKLSKRYYQLARVEKLYGSYFLGKSIEEIIAESMIMEIIE